MSRIRRIHWRSIRVRTTLAVTIALLLTFAALGAFVYQHTARSLDRALNENLSARMADTTTAVRQVEDVDALRELRFADRDSFVQIVDPSGRVLADSGEREGALLVDEATVHRARSKPSTIQRTLERDDPPARLQIRRTQLADGAPAVIIVGASREADQRALLALRTGLLVGGVVATLLISLISFLAVALALRPVEQMRREAATVTSSDSRRRLVVPPSGDELARLAETLNAMLARLDEGLQRERRLTADASHELRTPLALLKMELEVALTEAERPLQDQSMDDRLNALLETIRSSEAEVDRLVQLSESLLLLAQADQDELALARSDVNLKQLLTDTTVRYTRRAEREQRGLTVDGPDMLVNVDPIRISQALNNLIDNAFRHGAGTITVTARVEATTRAGEDVEHALARDLVIRVADQGTGFDPEFTNVAFDRFTRFEESRTSTGAGLGLSIVQAIAKAHGGSAGAAGSTSTAEVWIRIPLSGDTLAVDSMQAGKP
ncbi:MAG: integral rane sensor signal transduction histidine kinase [Thermoleophilia bacterium]|nr:integral rane sensor signal transduction histidine kinase [Thermoleophilia bacterium]